MSSSTHTDTPMNAEPAAGETARVRRTIRPTRMAALLFGLAVLPAFLADRDPILARVLPHEAVFTRTFWMSMPAEGKHLARMQAVWGFLKEVGAKEGARLVPAA